MPQLQFADFVPQLVWLAITFIALYLFLARVVLPRIGTVLEERRDRISRDLDEAEKLKAETENAIAAYEQAMAEARAKAHAIAQETRDKLHAEIEHERAEVDKKIMAKTAEAEERIAASKAEAMKQVNEIAGTTAQALVQELIGKTADEGDVSQAVSKALSAE